MSDLTGIDPVLANTDLVNRNIIFSVKDATPTQKGVDVKRISGDGAFFGQALMWDGITWIPRSIGMYYVDPINGEDNPLSPGDSTHPFKTINYAMNRIPIAMFSQFTQIKLADGVYHENIQDVTGVVNVSLFGNANDKSLVVIAGNPDLSSKIITAGFSNGHMFIKDMTIKPSANYINSIAAQASQNTFLQLYNVDFDLTSANGFDTILSSQNNGYLDMEYVTLRGSAVKVFSIINNGSMVIGGTGVDIIGNATYTDLVWVDMNGKMYISGNITNTGVLNGKKYDVRNNGDLAGVTKLPTSNLTAGTVTAGGRAN